MATPAEQTERRTRIAVILPSDGYRATAFLDAANRLGVDVIVVTDESPPMAAAMEDRLVVVDLDDSNGSAAQIVALTTRCPVDAVIGVDDQGVLIAATTSELLDLPGNPPDAVAATRDKAEMRAIFASWSIPQPDYRVVRPGADVAALAEQVGLPCVVKPTSLSASTGVIRADTPDAAVDAALRTRTIADAHGRPADEPLLIERFISGDEFSLEGLMVDGTLEVLAIFDKPEALDGPYFEETIYLTPTRLGSTQREVVVTVVAAGCRALGLHNGPIHAEVRISAPSVAHDPSTPVASDSAEHLQRRHPQGNSPSDGTTRADNRPEVYVLEIASRSIGGMCSRVLQFGSDISLEEVILRNALGRGTEGLERSGGASGVMMIPIPDSGLLSSVDGIDAARRVEGIQGLEITASLGRHIDALPEGGRYLGFVFARGSTPADVESSLRSAHELLHITIVDDDAEPPSSTDHIAHIGGRQ